MQKRWITDAVMGVVFIMLLAYHVFSGELHEWLGVIVTLAVAAHLVLNRHWGTSLSRGRWDGRRLAGAVVIALLAASFLACIVSGVIVSHHLFRAFIPRALRMNMFIHEIHHWAPWVLLLLMGLHLGMQGKPLWMRLMRALSVNTRATAYHVGSTALEIVVVLLGAAGWSGNSLDSRLLFHHVFATPTLALGGPVLVVSLVAVVGLGAVLGDKIVKLLAPKRRGS